MPESLPSFAELAAEEDELQFASFTNDDAWALGGLLVEAAREQGAPVAVDITHYGQQLFHAGLPGFTADNDDWIQKKIRVVQRCGHSSLAVGQLRRERGTTFEDVSGLDRRLYAAAGGCVPVIVRSVGPVGTVTVSGLPQLEDHRLAVSAIRAFLCG